MQNVAKFIVVALLFIGFACNEQNVEDPRTEFGEAYFPLSIGNTWIYEMDSVIVRPVVGGILFDSSQVQMREELVDRFTDQSGQLWYRGERSFRQNETEDWRFATTFLLGATPTSALRREGNLQFATLAFPPTVGVDWEGNSAFDEFTIIGVGGETIEMFYSWDYRIIASGEPAVSPEPDFPDVVRVQAANYSDLIDLRFVQETYARNIGLIYRRLEILHTQCANCCTVDGEINTSICLDTPWVDKVDKGFYLHQRLIDFQ